MQFYVMSGELYATGSRDWTRNKDHAFVWPEDELEYAKGHAESFRSRISQEELRYVHRRPDIPGHKDARVVTFLEE